jgi:hypothetical protein
VWAVAVSVSAAAPRVSLAALGIAVGKEVFDLLRARSNRIWRGAVIQSPERLASSPLSGVSEVVRQSLSPHRDCDCDHCYPRLTQGVADSDLMDS